MKRMVGMSLIVIFFLAVGSMAQQPAGTAPVPAEIQTAKTVFISNTGSIPCNVSGGSNRLYVIFYQQMQAAAGFKVVNDPQNADLILEARYFINLNFFKTPELQLSIYDRPTHALLWTLNQGAEPCALQKACGRNLETALAALAVQVTQLRSQTEVNSK